MIFASLGALLAWLFDWRAFLTILPGAPFMTCDSAACFGIAGLGLLFASRNSFRRARALGILLLVLGSSYLSASLTNTWLSFHYFFPHYTAAVVAPLPLHSCRVATFTATVFLLLGGFLILLSPTSFKRSPLALAAFLACAIPTLGVLGGIFYLSGLIDSGNWTGYLISMSLPTSFCTCVAGTAACALIWARTERSERRLLSTGSILSLLGLLLLFAGVNSAVGSHNRAAAQTTAEVQRLSRQINLIREIVLSVRKAETGERGFFLTGSNKYLQASNLGIKETSDAFVALRATTYDQFNSLQTLTDARLAQMATVTALVRNHQLDQARELVATGQGFSTMEAIDAEADRLISSLTTRLTDRLAANELSTRLLQNTIELSSAVAGIMICFGVVFLRTEIRRRTAVEADLRASSQNLQSKVEERTAEVRKYSDDLRAEAARSQAASDRLRLSLDLANVAVWIWNPQEDKTAWLGAVQQVYGFTAEELSNYRSFRELVFPEDRAFLDTVIANSVEKHQRFEAEFRIVRPKGELRWIAAYGDVVFDAKGQVTQVSGVNLNISEKKKVEQQLATSERHFRELAESMPQIVWTANAKGEVEYQNGRWHSVTGLPQGSPSPEERVRVVHPEDLPRLGESRAEGFRECREFELEFRLFDVQKQEYRWYWARSVPVRDDKGNVVRWFGTSTDIHERKVVELRLIESERNLREREQQLALLFENGLAGDYVWDFEKSTVTAHPAIWALFGEPHGRGTAPADWFLARSHPEDMEPMQRELAAAQVGNRTFDVEHRVVWPDGTVRWLATRGFHVRDNTGKPIQIHGLGFDITDRKLSALLARERLEAEVRQRTTAMQQLEVKENELLRLLAEKNTLFHEMHHRVKNNLQVISSLLNMQSDTLSDQTAKAALKESHQRVLSMALIHEQLYSNKELGQIDFEDFTQKLVGELFHSYVGETSRVTCRLNTKPVYLTIDHAIPLGLILNELTTNALKYAYPNGTGGEVSVDLLESTDRQVTLAISDQGIGLPDGFDWNNSKSMGLPIVDMLTQQLGGRLTVRSRPGATFKIEFPKETRKADVTAA